MDHPKYLAKNPLLKAYLKTADFLAKASKKTPIPTSPTRFLVANTAHIGDTIMMTAMLNVIHHLFPKAKISVVISSKSLPLLKDHPYIDSFHIIDHWVTNRSPLSLLKKMVHYRKTLRKAVANIKEKNYEVAIDTYCYFGNAIPTLKKAKIPVRIGYTSGGFGPWLTHPVNWKLFNQPVIDYYLPLLKILGCSEEKVRPFLRPFMTPKTRKTGHDILSLEKDYIVVHMGSGDDRKLWPLEKWQQLIKKFSETPIILTGSGKEEKERADLVAKETKALNFVDALSFDEYMNILKSARLLISVDSMAGHLAAALGTPSITLFASMNNIHHWSPVSPKNSTLTHPMPCAPCYRGCATMNCIRDIDPEKVYALSLKKLL